LEASAALLLADIGMQATYRFAQELRELGPLPSHAGILKALGTSAGIRQRALGRRLSILQRDRLWLVTRLAASLSSQLSALSRAKPGPIQLPHIEHASHTRRMAATSRTVSRALVADTAQTPDSCSTNGAKFLVSAARVCKALEELE